MQDVSRHLAKLPQPRRSRRRSRPAGRNEDRSPPPPPLVALDREAVAAQFGLRDRRTFGKPLLVQRRMVQMTDDAPGLEAGDADGPCVPKPKRPADLDRVLLSGKLTSRSSDHKGRPGFHAARRRFRAGSSTNSMTANAAPHSLPGFSLRDASPPFWRGRSRGKRAGLRRPSAGAGGLDPGRLSCPSRSASRRTGATPRAQKRLWRKLGAGLFQAPHLGRGSTS